MTDLDELDKLWAAGGGLPWKADPREYTDPDGESYWDVDGNLGGWVAHAESLETARWIAAAHNAVPGLVAELREARATIEAMKAQECENAAEDREANDRREYLDSLGGDE
ncbi:hypothetical protein 7S3_66 [uncultured Caudovirales phage]|uniref:Uncharacterized protein n=1 Tax=uncultured Caudovirales phage TaxID=2100421 RepID=A0A2H4J2C4_9CAUD|nr:hypothetical protein 7S3_66 [uncultured Caudovirales phage]